MQQEIQQITPSDIQAALQANSRRNQPAELSAGQILAAKHRFMEIAREVCPAYELDEEQKPIIADVFNWCMRLPGKYDPDKGLWIWGSIGSGKSTLLQIVNKFCYEKRPMAPIGYRNEILRFWIRIHRAIDICDAYAKDGIAGIEPIWKIGRLGIDDIGTENRITAHYGTPANVIGDLLLRRYDLRRTHQMHITSNLSPEQIPEVYGDRVYDRCGEMFNFIHLDGYTHRPEIK